jgi:hypothetical protein
VKALLRSSGVNGNEPEKNREEERRKISEIDLQLGGNEEIRKKDKDYHLRLVSMVMWNSFALERIW